MEAHNRAVAALSSKIRSFHELKVSFRLVGTSVSAASPRIGSQGSPRIGSRDASNTVDVGNLCNILQINPANRTAIVEPNVTMGELVEAALRFDLSPLTVLEFPGYTIGGSFSNTASASSSFKHGFFDASVNWCEIVLGNGDVIHASPTEHSDLFYGAVGARGTLGVPTLFEIQLMQVAKYVEVTYIPTTNATESIEMLSQCCTEPFDYIDGIQLAATRGIVVLGRITHKKNYSLRRFTRAQDPHFCQHAIKIAAAAEGLGTTETVPIQDYLFRYDRGAFWMSSKFGRTSRLALSPRAFTGKKFQALRPGGQASRFVIQDCTMPATTAAKLIEYVNQDFGIYPLWLCPVRADSQALLYHMPTKPSLLVNIGVWGPGKPPYGQNDEEQTRLVEDGRSLEARVRELGGWKWLYAQTFYTEQEFWSLYDKQSYDELRTRYQSGMLPSLYEKTKEVSWSERTPSLWSQ